MFKKDTVWNGLVRFGKYPDITCLFILQFLKGPFPGQKQGSTAKNSTDFLSFLNQTKPLAWSDPNLQFVALVCTRVYITLTFYVKTVLSKLNAKAGRA